jgi:hypothetical protein
VHIRVEIGQVWIIGDRFESCLPAQAPSVQSGSFAGSDIPGDDEVVWTLL